MSEETLEYLTSQNASLQKELNEKTEAYSALLKKYNQIQLLFSNTENSISETLEYLSQLEDKETMKQTKVHYLKQKLQNKRTESEHLKAENLNLKLKLENEEKLRKEMEAKVEHHHAQLSNLKAELEKVKSKYEKDKSDKLELMKKDLKNLREKYQRLFDLQNEKEAEYKKTQSTLSLLKETNELLLTREKELKLTIERLKLDQNKEQQKSQSFELNEKNNALLIEKKNLERKYYNLEKEFEKVKSENVHQQKLYQTKLETAKSEWKTLYIENKKLKQLVEPKKNLISKETQTDVTAQSLQQTLEQLKSENQQLKHKNDILSRQFENLEQLLQNTSPPLTEIPVSPEPRIEEKKFDIREPEDQLIKENQALKERNDLLVKQLENLEQLLQNTSPLSNSPLLSESDPKEIITNETKKKNPILKSKEIFPTNDTLYDTKNEDLLNDEETIRILDAHILDFDLCK